jgi:transcription initiation factor TFIID TATA-box-binding protein
MSRIEIQNVVASATIADELDLNALAAALQDAEYEPTRFPGLVLRMQDPKTAALLFRSGKMVCTGAKVVSDVAKAIKNVCDRIEKAGVNSIHRDPKIDIQNIVATSNLGAELNLNAVAIGLGLEQVEYEPEQFPGLVYRMKDPKVVLLLFGSGKLVCTGARKPEDAETAVGKIDAELKSLGLM